MTRELKIDPMKSFLVWHERGGYIQVFAKDKDDAIEAFYESIKSMVGHQMKICGCFGPEKPIDRTKVIKPVRVEEIEIRLQHPGNESIN